MPSNIHNLMRLAIWRQRPGMRWLLGAALVAVLYSVTYLLLDRVSTFESVQGTEISPWELAIPLMIGAVIEFGVVIAPLTILLPWWAEIVNRDGHPFGITALAAMICIGCINTGMGLFLRRALRPDRVNSLSGFTLLLVTIAIGELAGATLFSMALLHSGALTREALMPAVVTDWIGDVSGIVVVLPLVLLLRTREGLQLRQLRLHLGELLLQSLTLALVFCVTFVWLATTQLQLFYLFFVPTIWIALRYGAGVTAIAMVLLQVSVVVILATRSAAQPLVAIQLLMLVLAGTGIFMGIAVTNSKRLARLVAARDEQLVRVNRSTGIMELNSTIAHELNNPLAAVSNYLRAASLLLERPAIDQQLVRSTVHKAVDEAHRAVEVLGELRAFYRDGALKQEQLEPRKLVDDTLAALQARLWQWGISCSVSSAADIPLIKADAMQLSVVLHNLLINACDAVKDMDTSHKAITLTVQRSGDEVRFLIEDQGGGIAVASGAQLFWPLRSTKPAGMGLGLAISRALVEANGGRIWLERSAANGTCIAFAVPVWQGPVQEQLA